MKSYIIGSLVVVLVQSLVLAQGRANETCDISWYAPSGIQGVCGDGSGGYHTGVEDLNLCVANHNGFLQAQNE